MDLTQITPYNEPPYTGLRTWFSKDFIKRIKTKLPLDKVLHHGTSSHRLSGILRAKSLKAAPSGIKVVSFSTDVEVGEYWANLTTEVDVMEFGVHIVPVIIEIKLGDLLDHGYFLSHISDPVYGVGGCDGEYEIGCWSDIDLNVVPRHLVFTNEGIFDND